MINNIESKIDKDEEIPEIINGKNGKDLYMSEFYSKYENLLQKNYENYSIKEVNCLNKIMENTFSVDKFKSYINKEFLDNCEYKLIFMPDEFNMKEDAKFCFPGFGDKKRKKLVNIKHKNINKNYAEFVSNKNKRKFN